MNLFERYAGDASGEKLRSLWARILAGEIRRPGAYSRSALRFVSELDPILARECEVVARASLGTFIPTLGEWNEGDNLDTMLQLQTYGIISGAGGTINRNVVLSDDGTGAITGTGWGLTLKGTPGTRVTFDVVAVTRLGREVFSLLPPPDEVELLKALAGEIDKHGLERIGLGPVILRQAGGMVVIGTEIEVWVSGVADGRNV